MIRHSLPHQSFDTGLGILRPRYQIAMIHEDHVVRLYRCQARFLKSLDPEIAYSLLRLWINVRELTVNGYKFQVMRYPDLYISESPLTRINVWSYEISKDGLGLQGGSRSSNVETLHVELGLVELLLSRCGDRPHVWFHAFCAFFHEIEPRFRGKDDLFRTLKDVNLGGRTWFQQKVRMKQEIAVSYSILYSKVMSNCIG